MSNGFMMSPITYFGGKYHMLNFITKEAQNFQPNTVVDVFGGSGVVLLNMQAEVLVYNDLDSRLVNFFQVLRDRKDELLEQLEYVLHSRQRFYEARDKLKQDDKDDLIFKNAVEDAYYMLYIHTFSVSGIGQSFGFPVTMKRRGVFIDRVTSKIGTLNAVYEQVKNWTIDQLDFRKCMENYDTPHTLFYLDPPYVQGGENYHKGDFSDKDYKDLAEIKRKLDSGEMKGKYIMNVDVGAKKYFGEDNYNEIRKNTVRPTHSVNGETYSQRYEAYYTNIDRQDTSDFEEEPEPINPTIQEIVTKIEQSREPSIEYEVDIEDLEEEV